MYGIIYWQQLTFRRALPSAMPPLSSFRSLSLARSLARSASTPRGIVSPDTSPHRYSFSLSPSIFLSLALLPPLSVFFSFRFSLSHASFFHRTGSILCPFTSRSRPNFLIPSLFLVVTNKSKLSPAEKNARRFPEQRKAGFLGVICGDRSLNSQRQ